MPAENPMTVVITPANFIATSSSKFHGDFLDSKLGNFKEISGGYETCIITVLSRCKEQARILSSLLVLRPASAALSSKISCVVRNTTPFRSALLFSWNPSSAAPFQRIVL